MIDLNRAKEIANKKLEELGNNTQIQLAIIDDEIVEFENGWLFCYQSADYVNTGNFGALISGTAPLIVDKENESVHITDTTMTEDFYIEKYNKYRNDPEKFQTEIHNVNVMEE